MDGRQRTLLEDLAGVLRAQSSGDDRIEFDARVENAARICDGGIPRMFRPQLLMLNTHLESVSAVRIGPGGRILVTGIAPTGETVVRLYTHPLEDPKELLRTNEGMVFANGIGFPEGSDEPAVFQVGRMESAGVIQWGKQREAVVLSDTYSPDIDVTQLCWVDGSRRMVVWKEDRLVTMSDGRDLYDFLGSGHRDSIFIPCGMRRGKPMFIERLGDKDRAIVGTEATRWGPPTEPRLVGVNADGVPFAIRRLKDGSAIADTGETSFLAPDNVQVVTDGETVFTITRVKEAFTVGDHCGGRVFKIKNIAHGEFVEAAATRDFLLLKFRLDVGMPWIVILFSRKTGEWYSFGDDFRETGRWKRTRHGLIVETKRNSNNQIWLYYFGWNGMGALPIVTTGPLEHLETSPEGHFYNWTTDGGTIAIERSP